MTQAKVLFFDDEIDILETLRDNFEDDFQVLTANRLSDARRFLEEENPEILVVDKRMPEIDGIDFLLEDIARQPQRIRIMLTALADRDTILEAINRTHVWAFFEKPIEPEYVRRWRLILQNALEVINLRKEVRYLRDRIKAHHEGAYAAERLYKMSIAEQVIRAAQIDNLDILLQGETGTGKSMIARAIHYYSPRKDAPFHTVFVPTLSKELVEAELFGYKAGSFTGALRKDKKGWIEEAEGGILFLDEISEIPLSTQVKLLRFLQDKEYEMVGSSKTRRADVRIITATNRNLEIEVESGRFRKDLFFRLGHTISIPPLRERQEELPELINHFFMKYRGLNEQIQRVSSDAWNQLLLYPWPGNIREVERRIRDGLVLAESNELKGTDIFSGQPQNPHQVTADKTLKALKNEMEYHLVMERLQRYNGNRRQAACSLGITYEGLYKILKKHKI